MPDALSLAVVDWVTIAAYLTLVLFIGLWMSRTTETGEDLFLAGRSLPWWAIGLSLFASNISSTTLIGLMGAAYVSGISVSNYEWMASVVLVFFALVLAPRYMAARLTTMPEFLRRRFDARSALYFSGLTIITNIFVDTAGSLYAGALVLQSFFPSLNLTLTCLVLAAVAGLYTAAGGLAAVVYTDVLQAIVLLVGASLMTHSLFSELGYSWAAVTEAIPAERLSVIRPLSDPDLPWLGTLIGVPVLGFYFWCTNQFIVQRLLAAKSLNHARWGALLGAALKLPVVFIMVLPGTMAAVLMPGLKEADLVFPTVVSAHLPVGLVGLVLAGLVAAIMSSIDSTLNSASTLVTVDFILPRYPSLTGKQLALIGRLAMVVIMVVAAVWAPQIAHFRGLFAYLQQMLAYIVPPVAALFLLGMLWPGATPTAALSSLLLAHATSVAVFVLQTLGALPPVHFTIVGGGLFLWSLLLLWGISRVTPQASEAQRHAFAAKATDGAPPAWASPQLLSGVLLAATAALVLAFW